MNNKGNEYSEFIKDNTYPILDCLNTALIIKKLIIEFGL